MAALDTVKVQKIYTETVNSVTTTTIGVEERTSIADLLALGNSSASAVGQASTVITQTAPAAAPAAFADLTAAATAYNAMRTALIAARVLK